jgi:hypothetical protein
MAYTFAIDGNRLASMIWLREHKVPFDLSACIQAAAMGSLTMLA